MDGGTHLTGMRAALTRVVNDYARKGGLLKEADPNFSGDGRVLADAWQARADFFITLDRQHFLDNEHLRAALPFPLGTPGDFLLW